MTTPPERRASDAPWVDDDTPDVATIVLGDVDPLATTRELGSRPSQLFAGLLDLALVALATVVPALGFFATRATTPLFAPSSSNQVLCVVQSHGATFYRLCNAPTHSSNIYHVLCLDLLILAVVASVILLTYQQTSTHQSSWGQRGVGLVLTRSHAYTRAPVVPTFLSVVLALGFAATGVGLVVDYLPLFLSPRRPLHHVLTATALKKSTQ